MKICLKYTLGLLILALVFPMGSVAGGMEDDPLLTKLVINQLEVRDADGATPLVWDAEAWIGKDLHKLWIKTDGALISGQVEEMELQALYSRAVAPFWDLQLGWRRDIRPTPQRDWLALGFKGLAPYYFDIDSAVFIGTNGRTALRLQAEYDLMLTQRLVLVPDFEVNFYGRNDPAVGIGKGISNTEAGLRLRYEIRREFAPYIGINWNRVYGNTADFARSEGVGIEETQLLVGVRLWF
ncbi:copper resistance protein B [Geopsychrobacter electrodiphilus]|uniref:copper resistance protein B n=1 Tax=Geopsychrobacter electrodiphilus TaxID=225196 RepID=UPI0003617AB3|nr:copper resistance protein B [Geopsychrobacter electrodiphilus]